MPLRHVDVKDKLAELLPERPDWDALLRLGDLTKLRVRSDGSFYRANYESGLLLYALVRRFRPRSILEIGTGRGFGALSLAMGLRDAGVDGCVLTVDVKGYDEKQSWPIDEGSGPRVAELSLRDVWERLADRDLLSRVERACGSAREVLRRLRESGSFRADLVYIDGEHTWTAVRHDYLASLLLVGRPFRILLDDYIPGSDLYGVRRLVDEEVVHEFEAEAVYTDRRWHGGENASVPLERAAYAQVLVDSERARVPLERLLDPRRLRSRLERHRRFGGLRELLAGIRARLR